MMADNVFIDELKYRLGIIGFKGLGFYLFNEMVNGDDDISFPHDGGREGSHDINTYLLERFSWFLDRLKGYFTTFNFPLLAVITGLDVFNNIFMHVRLEVEFLSLDIGIFL